MGKWEIVQIGDVCEILDNMRVPVTASERKKGIYPYYGANGIQDYVDDYIFDDELVLLAEDGGNFGSKDKPIAYRVSGKCWVNNHAHVLKPKSILDVGYLCYSIMFYDVSQLISGTTRAKLNQAAMRKMTIPLPPFPVQQKIAGILDCASTLIEKRKAQIAKLDLLVKSQFVTMFGDPVVNPMGWEVSTIGASCHFVKDGPHVSPKYVEDGTGVPFISTRNLVAGAGIDWRTAKYISETDYKEYAKRCKPEKGDVLYTKGGTTGVARYVDTDIYFANWVHVAVLKFGSNLNGIFFENMLNSSYCYQQSQLLTKGIANRDLVLGSMKQIQFYLPPLPLQTQFADFVRAVDKSKAEMQRGLAKLELLYKSLMQKCFSGEIF